MVLDGAVEIADRGGECGVLRHRGPQSRKHVLAQGRIIDAEHAPLAHDGAPGHDQLVDMTRGGPREQQIERIQIAMQAVVVHRVPVEQQDVRGLSGRELAALLRVQNRPAAIAKRHAQDVRAFDVDAKADAAVEQMREPHVPQTIVVLIERKTVEP